MEQSELMAAAIDYVNRGFAIFPLQPRGKVPITKNGVKDATTDIVQVQEWWSKHPNANIAIATGQKSNGLCVIDLDIDDEKGVDGAKTMRDWEALHGRMPKTWFAMTGRGGCHYFFKSDEPVKNRVGILPGIDVRGDNGYIVAPPSIHPNGTKYKWRDKLSPDDVPCTSIDDNIRFFLYHDNTALQTRYVAPDLIPAGERNDMLFRFASMMQAKGASDQAVFAATKAENESKCNPPVSEKELTAIVNSALKYEKGKPIYIDASGEATQGHREPIFDVTDKGIIKKTWHNIKEAIEFDEALYEHIRYNTLLNSIFVYGALPWEQKETYRAWSNTDDASLKSYLEKRYGFNSTEKIMDALSIVAHEHRFNPVVETLEGIYAELKDKCSGAIRRLLPEYMGAEDSEYHYEVMKTYMLGAICRAYHPGCKFDYSIILYGTQGFGKSEFLRRLAISPDWFNDNFNTFDGDKAIEKLSGMWIVEMAELKALKSAKDAESFKSFLTSRVDTYRAPYARRSEQRPRMCVFAGTTNNQNVFVDKTGNRRFLPIITRKGKQKKSLFGDADSVNQDFRLAWAEAMDLFMKSNKEPQLILPDGIQEVAEQMQEEFSEDDYRVGLIQSWLDNTNASKVCVPMLIEYALKADIQRVQKQQKREIMEILDNEIQGWSRVKNRDKGRMYFSKYGYQIAFLRENE